MALNEQDVFDLYNRANASWFFDYNGNPEAPHAELTSGLCSDGYLDTPLILCDPRKAELLADELARRLFYTVPNWVIGSPYSAITFSYEVARKLRAYHGHTEKDQTDAKRMRWRRWAIGESARVLQVEEIIVTLGTTLEVRRAVEEENPRPVQFLPVVGTIVYRPADLNAPTPFEIVALARREIKTWGREVCPLHKQGSRALRPKEHWAEFIDSSIRQ